ncbi:MAG: PqqD family peptide modification chaperone [Deltaproteobacteria bacterium]|nr:PqqD family peptide modification chaperone [Deltaproteobacteria bacterium]
MSSTDPSWNHLWATLAAAARGAVLKAPTTVHEVRLLADERGASGLLALGLGEPPPASPRAPSRGTEAPLETLRRVHAALDAARIAHVFFKGPFADALLWGGQGLRAGNDVDVLLAPDDEAAALAALAPAFTLARSHGLDATAALSKARRLLPLDPSLCELDLHLRPLNDPPFRAAARDVLASARTWPTAQGPMPGPDPALTLVWSAGNLAGGRLQGLLRQAADAARLVHLHPVDWDLVVATARSWRASAATWGFLRLLAEQLGATIPAPTLEALAPPGPVGRVIERIFGVHGAPLTPDSAVLGVFAVEWALTGRPLWPAERILRTGALRVADRVLDALDASRRAPPEAMVPGASPPRNPVPVAMDSKVRVPPDVLMQEVDGEAVLLDLRTETYFGLDEVGTLLFRTLKDQGTLSAAVDAGLAAFEVERDELTGDLLALVEDLLAQGLLEVEP